MKSDNLAEQEKKVTCAFCGKIVGVTERHTYKDCQDYMNLEEVIKKKDEEIERLKKVNKVQAKHLQRFVLEDNSEIVKLKKELNKIKCRIQTNTGNTGLELFRKLEQFEKENKELKGAIGLIENKLNKHWKKYRAWFWFRELSLIISNSLRKSDKNRSFAQHNKSSESSDRKGEVRK